MNKGDVAALLAEGRAAVAAGDEAGAEIWFARAVEAAPDDPEAHVELGRCLNRQGDRRGAIQSMSRAVSIDPDAHAALNRLRWLLRDDRLEPPSALARIQARGVEVASVLDVGASDGTWSIKARPCWPQARYHLVEAFGHWREKLEALCAAEPAFSHVIAAAGATEGEVWFYNDPDAPYGGAASTAPGQGHWSVPQVSLAGEVARLGLPGPYLIKLDTHGFERPILEGAASILAQASLVVIETYIFHIHPEAMLFHEICAYMAARGFRVIDMSEPLWRERDRALWQVDLFFVRDDRPEFATNSYS
ncbi:MAG: FkbM family methyltransferase [Niveispirillum sp.]|nr:FkbM family methyltransferase [Niveispirillum sp.]